MKNRDVIFLTTQWTHVLAARGDTPEAGAMLRTLCASYYEPIVRFLCQGRRDEESARDEAHAFFEWVLSRDAFAAVEKEKGRFRSYLLGALKHFLANRQARSRRLKRGGGNVSAELCDATTLESWAVPPDQEFDRQWALHVLNQALKKLEQMLKEEGERTKFLTLHPFLVGDGERGELTALAKASGVSETALRSQLYRLRQRFRSCVRSEITPTLRLPAELNDEMEELLAALVSR